MDRLDAEIIVALARNNMNISMVGREMIYNRNSISYHIDKIKKDTGLDARNFFDLGTLYALAVAVLEG